MTNTRMIQDNILTPAHVRQNLDVQHHEDGGITHIYQDDAGKIHSIVYHLFPGITLIRKDVKRQSFISNWRDKPERGLIIEHCWDGRLECQVEQDCLYHAPGDVIVFRTDYSVRNLQYPLNYFRSIAISIDLDQVDPELVNDLGKINFNMDSLIVKYQLEKNFFCVLKKNTKMDNIFKEIHDAPESVKIPYLKVKVFELLLLLVASIPEIEESPNQRISRAQAAVAKAAHQYLVDHPYERITIDALAEKFSVSSTHLKTGFRAVYGTSIKRFDREQKMQLAGQLLKNTDRQIGEIASQFGYTNTSKFSSAFQSIMGKNPHEYRSCGTQKYT